MNYRGKTYKTIGEVFNEALRLARTDSYEAKEFFKEYINWISTQNHYSWDKATEIAKSNLGYFAGYYDEEVCDIIYKTYQCSHPIFGDKPFSVSAEEAYKKGIEWAKNLNKIN